MILPEKGGKNFISTQFQKSHRSKRKMQNSVFSCPICYNEFNQTNCLPRIIIACGHTICTTCLETILASQNEGKCPFDKIKFPSQKTQVTNFPVNFALRQIVEEKLTSEDQRCPKHKEIMKMVCLDDNSFICECCLYYDHVGHKMKPMKVLGLEADAKRKLLETSLTKLDDYNKEISDIVEENRAHILGVIKSKFQYLIWFLHRLEKEVTFEVDSIFDVEKNKWNKLVGLGSGLRTTLAQKIFDLKDKTQEKNILSLLAEDITEITQQVEQSISLKSSLEVHHSLRKLTQPFTLVLEEYMNLASTIKLPPGRPAKSPSSNSNRNVVENNNTFTFSLVNDLFFTESQETQLLIVAKNSLLETDEFEGGEGLVGEHTWSDAKELYLRLHEDDFSDDYIKALFYIFRKVSKISCLKLQVTPSEYPLDEIVQDQRSFVDLLKQLFQAFSWKLIDLESLEINVSGCKFGDELALLCKEDLLPKMRELKNLTLKFQELCITDKSIEIFSQHIIPKLKKLQHFQIDISAESAENPTASQLSVETQFGQKYFLRLRSSINGQTVQRLVCSSPPHNPEYFELDLGGTNITDESAEQIFWSMENLKYYFLSLNATRITDQSLILLAQKTLSRAKLLQVLELDLTATQVTDSSLTKILSETHSLQSFALFLGKTLITDKTLESIAENIGPLMDKMESFNISLRHTRITQQGIARLFASMSLVKNFMINLGGTPITDQTVELFIEKSLSTMRALESFEFCVYETSITDQSIISLFTELKAIKKFVLDVRETKVTNKCMEFFIQQKLPTMKPTLENIEFKVNNTNITEIQKKNLEETLSKFKQ